MRFEVKGMSCAACSARIEKAVSQIQGVETCSVNLLTNSMEVEGTVSSESVIDAVSKAGYSAFVENKKSNKRTDSSLRLRLLLSFALLIPLMYFSMGHMVGLGMPPFLESAVLQGVAQMTLSLTVMLLNLRFFVSGVKGVLNKAPNMDTLVALGSFSAFAYSVYSLIIFKNVHDLYFESAAMILTLVSVGKLLEEKTKHKTTDAIRSLIELAPKTAIVVVDGCEVTVDIDKLSVGDIFVVRPGESIPADAEIVEGESSVNEAALTGESIPVDKSVGDKVSAATINLSGYLKCRAVSVGEDTALAKIIKLVSDASASKAPIAKIADKVSGIFVPIVFGVSCLTFIGWLLLDANLGFAVARGVSVLVISCPCALGLATPVAIMVGNGVAAKNGILFKSAKALEFVGKSDIIVLDKTGTVTLGKPSVTDIIPFGSISEDELLTLAYSLEYKSEHPLAFAVKEKAKSLKIKACNVTDFKAIFGRGVVASLNGRKLYGGNLKYIESMVEVSEPVRNNLLHLSNKGKTPLIFADDNGVLGIIAVADTLREDSKRSILELKKMNLRVVMLTGDNELTAKAVAEFVGINEVYFGLMPEDKNSIVLKLRESGRVAFVGDGINDSPSLVTADTGIAIGAGTDIAIDSADIVLMKNSLSDVVSLIKISKSVLHNIKENLFWAFFYNLIGIPLAAGLFINVFGWELSPMFGAAAMSLSSISVVFNALRLRFLKFENTSKKESNNMKKIIKTFTLKVDGMMCEHCAARVKEAVLKQEEVDSCEINLEKKEVKVNLWVPLDEVVIVKTIEALGYKVI